MNKYDKYIFTLVTMKGCHYCDQFKQYTWFRFESEFTPGNTLVFDESDFKNRYFEGFPTVLITTNEDEPQEIGLIDGFFPLPEFLNLVNNVIAEYESNAKQAEGFLELLSS